MQRYFANHYEKDQFYLSADDRHHIVNVMRLNVGDQICCVFEQKSAICTITEITNDCVCATVLKWEEATTELPIHVTIASGLPKGDKLEWIIQKGTELGAYKFIPFAATRSVVKWDEKKGAKKVERWQKIAKEAAEQSHRHNLPEVMKPLNFQALLEQSKGYDYKLIAFEEAAKAGESTVLHKTLSNMEKGQSLLFVFGPEGGLTEKEVVKLEEYNFASCSLGPRILRTETAPLHALSAVSYHFELMR